MVYIKSLYIKSLEEISLKDIAEVGGKAASLGELIKVGFSVPSGFVITIQVFREFSGQELPADVRTEVLNAFDSLGMQRVVVRSSGVTEDSLSASWAGQLETFLNVTRENLIERISDCWHSIHSERALAYAAQQGVPEEELIVAVIVQEMVDSEVSGVMFTVNPVTKSRDEIVIEAGLGLGESIVQGKVIPDNFLVDKNSKTIKNESVQADKAVLSNEQVEQLSEIGLKIEEHYGFPQDIEWALEKNRFYILQSRPITTL